MPETIDKCQWCKRTITIPELANEDHGGTYSHPSCHLVNVILQDWQGDVEKFHKKLGIPLEFKPIQPSAKRVSLRFELHQEEYDEIQEALITGNLIELADGICDLIYVLLGTAIEHGINIAPIWKEVQRTNMLKEGGAMREDGKILKPEGWLPPNIRAELLNQGMIDNASN